MVVKVVVMCVCVCSCVCKCSGLRLMAGIFHLSSSFLFETGSHYVSLTGLELAMLASSPGIHRKLSCLCLPRVGYKAYATSFETGSLTEPRMH